MGNGSRPSPISKAAGSYRVRPSRARRRSFDHLLERAQLSPDAFERLAPARTESDAALAVLEGKADAAFGLASVAAQYRLPFTPLIEERFDLLADRRAWFEPPMQLFLKFCRSEAFTERARELSGYDISEFGEVRFNGA